MECLLTDKWNKYYEEIDASCKDIYFTEEYVKLYETDSKKAVCVVCTEKDNILLMPFLRERIEINEFDCLKSENHYVLYDFETAYGYGGPITNSTDKIWVGCAIKSMMSFLSNENYLCGFIRFSTLINNYEYLRENADILYDRKTVVIDTSMSPEDIWKNQISSKNRNMIRKAENNGLFFRADYEFERLKEFINLYNNTMKRLNAEEFYFFEEEYYTQFKENFHGKAFIGEIFKENKMICGALFMYGERKGHYHLEGSDHEYSGLGANNLLLWKVACEMNRLGINEFHLGGGYNADPDNSLLKFKKSFSRNEKDFYIGKMIFNEKIYQNIKNEWLYKNPEKIDKYGKYLLFYKY